jgi:hypothetical protein
VVGSDQPLLEISDCAVRQRHCRLRALPQLGSQGLATGDMLETSFWQSGEALQAVGIYR